MKHLTLIRHAQAMPSMIVKCPDIERRLSKKGKQDAIDLGNMFKEKKTILEAIYSSTAKRAYQTAELIAQEVNYPAEIIHTDNNLYEADAFQLLKFIQRLSDQFEHLAIIAHNPALTNLSCELTHQLIKAIPPCGIVELALNVESWGQIYVGTAHLINTRYPS